MKPPPTMPISVDTNDHVSLPCSHLSTNLRENVPIQGTVSESSTQHATIFLSFFGKTMAPRFFPSVYFHGLFATFTRRSRSTLRSIGWYITMSAIRYPAESKWVNTSVTLRWKTFIDALPRPPTVMLSSISGTMPNSSAPRKTIAWFILNSSTTSARLAADMISRMRSVASLRLPITSSSGPMTNTIDHDLQLASGRFSLMF